MATSQPVLAQVWADLYAVQQARFDRLTATLTFAA